MRDSGEIALRCAPAGSAKALVGAGVAVTPLGFGGAAIGNLYTEVREEIAAAAVIEAYRQGVRYFDTAPYYGYGLSEERLGRALAEFPQESVVVSTKVGRLIHTDVHAPKLSDGFAVSGRRAVFDYSRSGVLRSFEGSLQRLRRATVDILLLHDVGSATHGSSHVAMLAQALDEALPAMAELKASGACRAIGIGVNEERVCLEIMERFDLDCILLASRYTLLEQSALNGVMAEASRRGVGILIGGPFNSGLLANGAGPGRTYNYQPVDEATFERARRIYEICAGFGVDVGAAALQFVLAHPAVVSVVPGLRTPQEVATAADRLRTQLPGALWQALQDAGLLLSGAPIPSCT